MADAHTLGITLSILCAVFAALLFFILLAYLRRSIVRPLHTLQATTQKNRGRKPVCGDPAQFQI